RQAGRRGRFRPSRIGGDVASRSGFADLREFDSGRGGRLSAPGRGSTRGRDCDERGNKKRLGKARPRLRRAGDGDRGGNELERDRSGRGPIETDRSESSGCEVSTGGSHQRSGGAAAGSGSAPRDDSVATGGKHRVSVVLAGR